MFKHGIVCLFIFSFSIASNASDCLDWFLKSGLAPKSKNCELKCAVTPVDMDSFACTSQCEELCSKSIAERVLQYAPRLTEGDKVVISEMPFEAYRAFIAKEKVDKLTEKLFTKARRKDESDAFRHFVWSALLTSDIGEKKAQIILNAHEEDSTQSKAEKDMDLFNNSKGIEFASKFKKVRNKPEINDIEKAALDQLRRKKLRVLESKHDVIPGGYYSK